MRYNELREMCLAIMLADTESKVVAILDEAGYWNNSDAWRFYGDRESNYNAIGNQQSRPEAAIVEKIINSVDARLMNECMLRGLDPEDPEAPKSIREAVGLYFEEHSIKGISGSIREWPEGERTKVARDITLAATGATPSEGNPCFVISDLGEGQTPLMLPNTILSLDRSNKLRIPFVQGQFNMGGTGALIFCGSQNIQFVLSRRNPAIINGSVIDESDHHWGFTVIRRENPIGQMRSSVFTYLAPLGVDEHPNKGDVLHFEADKMPLFPEGPSAYSREVGWGTLIKLYEYSITGKWNILLKGGLLRRLDLLLPEIALPIRLYECRTGYKGHKGSFETTLSGITVRLDDDKAKNLEPGFPDSHPLSVAGEKLMATIYAFKQGRADTYRRSEGIIFTVNGQTHGHFTSDFFRRGSIKLSYLANSLLVIVDCSEMSKRGREDLFKNSRDRLNGGDLRNNIEAALELLLKEHPGLRALKERRRREQVESKLGDSKPLTDILGPLIKQSAALASLFRIGGLRLPNPFQTQQVKPDEIEFTGERFPSYFKFKGIKYGRTFKRDCHINMRARITFETDAENCYFNRKVDPGEFSLDRVENGEDLFVEDYVLNLHNGIASLNLQLPKDCVVDDVMEFVASVTDDTRSESFENRLVLRVVKAASPPSGPQQRRKPRSQKEGKGREEPVNIQLPNITEVYENPSDGDKGWSDMDPPFTKFTALRVRQADDSNDDANGEGESNIYDFFINLGNIYLKTELKPSDLEIEITKIKFLYGLVLIGLALIRQDLEESKGEKETDVEEQKESDNGAEQDIEEKVEAVTSAIAPVLIPMIDYLGAGLDFGTDEAGASGEDT